MVLLLPLALALSAATSPCDDVFDRAPGCSAVDEEPLDGMAEPMGAGGLDDPLAVMPARGLPAFSADAMAWRLIATSGVVGVLGTGLFAASVAYGTYATATNAGALDPLLLVEFSTQMGAIGAFAVAGLLAGAGAIFFVFDPTSGRLRFSIDED